MEFVKNRLMDDNNKQHGKGTKGRKDGFECTAGMNATSYYFRCHNCGKEGHKRSECRYKGNGCRNDNPQKTDFNNASGNMATADDKNSDTDRCGL